MKHIVLYSGGAASAYVAWLVNQEHHDDTILLQLIGSENSLLVILTYL